MRTPNLTVCARCGDDIQWEHRLNSRILSLHSINALVRENIMALCPTCVEKLRDILADFVRLPQQTALPFGHHPSNRKQSAMFDPDSEPD